MLDHPIHRGLQDVVVLESCISRLATELGDIVLRGYPLGWLVQHCSFRQVACLLIDGGSLISPSEASEVWQSKSNLVEPPALFRDLARRTEDKSAVLAAVVAWADAEGAFKGGNLREQSWSLATNIPFWCSLLHRVDAPATDIAEACMSMEVDEATWGQGFANACVGEGASTGVPRMLDRLRIIYCEHELNAATFAARVCASTRSSVAAAAAVACLTLKGHNHGGAVGLVGEALRECRELGLEQFMEKVRQGYRVPGFGHRVYRQGDPRFHMIRRLLSADVGLRVDWSIVDQLCARLFADKGLTPNLDLAAHQILRAAGIAPHDMCNFISSARTIGWMAHIQEERASGRLIRPRSVYTGPEAPQGLRLV